ncbi:hypothetical protein PB2503_01042 [Parvularcula bermudensis HTCC2503]|uniref:Rhamnosyltransferase n=1 Tax=Parvularcula bermudensis (strain ATCC BAA-594 / HTCC2503 / KCTC 12087) TaxID=314260 RepID=E0TB85_PARBH|nr:ferritin-like domain-containing protein [Parvularcula bermudensis]ADM08289.1 hypothetical protein PB2503_01042 [Parvularcula bermudensis HTCC2503]
MQDERRRRLAAVLLTSDPLLKVERALAGVETTDIDGQAEGRDSDPADLDPWPLPARRARPPLLDPADMPKRGSGSDRGRAALLHAIAHIEINAIDLAADMAGRFTPTLPAADRQAFLDDWTAVMMDEARHFRLLTERLVAYGVSYGDLPAHSGLFDAALRTRDDVAARLAVAPLVLEARGLDVTPAMINRLRRAGDTESARVLEEIYEDEIGHVAAGVRWFERVCAHRGLAPATAFRDLVAAYYGPGLKKPFNQEGRRRSGFPVTWYDAPELQKSFTTSS